LSDFSPHDPTTPLVAVEHVDTSDIHTIADNVSEPNYDPIMASWYISYVWKRSLLTQPCPGSTSFLSSPCVLPPRTTTPNRSENFPQTTLFFVGIVLGVLYAARAISSSFQSTKAS
jgi:hypothetical protein